MSCEPFSSIITQEALVINISSNMVDQNIKLIDLSELATIK